MVLAHVLGAEQGDELLTGGGGQRGRRQADGVGGGRGGDRLAADAEGAAEEVEHAVGDLLVVGGVAPAGPGHREGVAMGRRAGGGGLGERSGHR